MSLPLLSMVTFLPLVGSVVVLCLKTTPRVMHIAFAFSCATLIASLMLFMGFDTASADMQWMERSSWIPSLGVQYLLGIDGVSLLLILLTTLLCPIAIMSSSSAIFERVKEYYAAILFLETGMIGVFVSLDLFLFYIFWEIMLVPMYFLIGIWGGGRRLYSAIKFFLYTLFGSLFMLLAILAIYFLNANPQYGTGTYTFDLMTLYQMRLPLSIQLWLFWAFFLGFAIKVPMFPFHTWLPDAHTDAPTAGSVLLAGILLKMGTYGFVRFCLPLFPIASQSAGVVSVMVGLSLIGIIYGALVALVQTDIKRLVAYSSVSHLGFVMLGIFALNPQGLSGSVLQMVNHGLSTGALFLIVGMLYERRHTREISAFGGLAERMPIFALLFGISMFSSIGLPGLNGFIGEFLILVGAYQYNRVYAGLALLGIILGAAYMLWLYQRVMFGVLDKPENQNLADVNRREIAYMLPLVLLMFWIGLYPKPFLRLLEPPITKIVAQLTSSHTKAISKQAVSRVSDALTSSPVAPSP